MSAGSQKRGGKVKRWSRGAPAAAAAVEREDTRRGRRVPKGHRFGCDIKKRGRAHDGPRPAAPAGSPRGPAAVHDEAVAGDEGGGVGQEEKGRADDLVVRADAVLS